MITVLITTDQPPTKSWARWPDFSCRDRRRAWRPRDRETAAYRARSRAARKPATMKAVSDTFWMIWVMGGGWGGEGGGEGGLLRASGDRHPSGWVRGTRTRRGGRGGRGGLAEGKEFEPLRRLPAYTLSRRAPSTTRPPLLEKVPHYSEATLWFNMFGLWRCPRASAHAILKQRWFERERPDGLCKRGSPICHEFEPRYSAALYRRLASL